MNDFDWIVWMTETALCETSNWLAARNETSDSRLWLDGGKCRTGCGTVWVWPHALWKTCNWLWSDYVKRKNGWLQWDEYLVIWVCVMNCLWPWCIPNHNWDGDELQWCCVNHENIQSVMLCKTANTQTINSHLSEMHQQYQLLWLATTHPFVIL